LWQHRASKSGDSRVVRYAEKILALVAEVARSVARRTSAASSRRRRPLATSTPRKTQTMADAPSELPDGEALIYVTTPNGVTRIRPVRARKALRGSTLVVDTLAHALRVDDREVSLERRRALEPLVVQLLARARKRA
jgi:hypothetical protein